MNSTRSWSPARLWTATVLAAWAALFWYLLLSERSSLYLSTRTDWVIPVGAVLLTAAALGHLASGRVESPQPLANRGAWGLGLLLVPLVTVLALPPASLGSFAAGRRSTFLSAGFATSSEDIASGDLSLIDVIGATRSDDGMRALVKRAGTEVTFVGFVTRDNGFAADEFILNRFVVSCCVADALGVQIRVVGAPPGRFGKDDWVRVTGRIFPLGPDVVVQASNVVEVPEPKHPYLSP
jgi:uncharacterized repeat protein (TIGR03943 family)